MSKQYVRHISGQGERWIVEAETSQRWKVMTTDAGYMASLDLPKSEYIICEQPEIWMDVTNECEVGVIYTGIAMGTERITGPVKTGYRLRKVSHGQFGCTFIVERKEMP